LDKTNAERQRRYIQRLKARAASASGTASHEIAALKRQTKADADQIATLRGKLAELQNRKPRATTKPVNPDGEVAGLKATITYLRRALKHFQKRKDGKIDSRSYTIIRSRMHPDRVSDPEKKARYKIAFEVFGELEKAVVDKEQGPLTREEWDARKKPEAKKRQPAASPRSAPSHPSR
jgi:hypothetical protein